MLPSNLPFIGNVYEIRRVIHAISHIVDLRPIILCPVGQYLLFTLVFECSRPDSIEDPYALNATQVWFNYAILATQITRGPIFVSSPNQRVKRMRASIYLNIVL